MKSTFKLRSIVYIVLSFNACFSASASNNISFVYKDSTLEPKDAKPHLGFYLAKGYDSVPTMPYTNQWRAAFSGASDVLTLVNVNSQGEQVDVVLDKAGVEIFYPNSPILRSELSTDELCEFRESNLTSSFVGGEPNVACKGERLLELHSVQQPFQYVSPAIKLNASSLASSFQGKAAGVYAGSLAINYRYYFKNINNINTHRDLTVLADVSIEYQPSYIDSVTLLPSSLVTLTPDYMDTSQIEAQGAVRVRVEGIMPAGLALQLPMSEYSLTSATDSIGLTIRCPQCSDTQLVQNGSVSARDTTIITTEGSASAEFDLELSYSVKVDDVTEGVYSSDLYFVLEIPIN